MAPDPAVVDGAYRAAQAAGASNKVLLALFEAGLVESGFRNLNYGDRDSVGFLQQRSGWGSVADRMNVATATGKFVAKAKPIEGRYLTAGGLAQAVQVSAFPGKYDLMAGQAVLLLRQAEGRAGGGVSNAAWIPNPFGGALPIPDGGATDVIQGWKAALGYVDAANKWAREPSNWERVAKVVLGAALLVAGLRVAVQPAVSSAVGAVGSVLPVGKVSGAIGAVAKGGK